MTTSATELMSLALQARENAYCPYSGFAVGAALLAQDGKIFTGCNVENAGYTATNCAERTAFFKAVSEGVHRFTAIAVAGGKQGQPPASLCAPCGVCRQVMAEFCGPDFEIYLTDGENLTTHTLSELLPLAFGPGNLARL